MHRQTFFSQTADLNKLLQAILEQLPHLTNKDAPLHAIVIKNILNKTLQNHFQFGLYSQLKENFQKKIPTLIAEHINARYLTNANPTSSSTKQDSQHLLTIMKTIEDDLVELIKHTNTGMIANKDFITREIPLASP